MRSSLKKGTNMKSKIRQMANVELTQEDLEHVYFEKFRTSMSDCSLAGLINWHELCNCMLNPLFAGDAFPSNNHYCQRIWHTQCTIYFLSDNFIYKIERLKYLTKKCYIVQKIGVSNEFDKFTTLWNKDWCFSYWYLTLFLKTLLLEFV